MLKLLKSGKAEPSWQGLMLSASHEAFRDAYSKNNDDNASMLMALHCPDAFASDTCTCTDDSSAQLLLRILRWIKLLVLKLAASYYALPVVLALAPMTVGVLIGFYFGSKSQSRRARTKHKSRLSTFYHVFIQYFRSILWPLAAICASAMSSRHVKAAEYVDGASEGLTKGFLGTRRPQTFKSTATFPESEAEMREREELARQDLLSDRETLCESGVDADQVPNHVAIIMDGNRRYGEQKYGNATSGHWDGSQKVLQVAKWCIAEHVKVLTVFAFSTENWRRDPSEVAALMALFTKYCEELRVEALAKNIRVRILSTDDALVPAHVKQNFDSLQHDTEQCRGGLEMNICLSYGARGEIVNACRQLAEECAAGHRRAECISENDVAACLLTRHTGDPDVLIRTSGEERISNFLLWQIAYTELYFLDCHWPDFQKDELLDVIRSFAHGRRRRFGK